MKNRINKASLFGGFEFTRVEVLIKVFVASFGDTVEASGDSFEKSIFGELGASVAGVAGSRTAEILNGCRRQVAVLTDELQDSIIGWDHPIGALTHFVRRIWSKGHTNTD